MRKKLAAICISTAVILSLCISFFHNYPAKALGTVFVSGQAVITGTETTTATARLFRNAITSTVAAPKAFPGTTGSGTFYCKVLTVAPASTVSYEVQVNVATTDLIITDRLFWTAYLDSFDPANLSSNYLADPGSSVSVDNPATFSFTVPAGKELLLAYMNTNIYTALPATNTYEISFLTQPQFAVEVQNDGNGQASADVTGAEYGDTVTLTATPNAHYRFLRWDITEPADLVITNNTFTMPVQGVTVKAIFEQIPQVYTSLKLTPPSKTSYKTGDTLNLEGLVVKAAYDYGNDETVTGYTVSPAAGSVLTAANTQVTVSYTKGGVTKTATFAISVTPPPTATPAPTGTPTATPAPTPTQTPALDTTEHTADTSSGLLGAAVLVGALAIFGCMVNRKRKAFFQ